MSSSKYCSIAQRYVHRAWHQIRTSIELDSSRVGASGNCLLPCRGLLYGICNSGGITGSGSFDSSLYSTAQSAIANTRHARSVSFPSSSKNRSALTFCANRPTCCLMEKYRSLMLSSWWLTTQSLRASCLLRASISSLVGKPDFLGVVFFRTSSFLVYQELAAGPMAISFSFPHDDPASALATRSNFSQSH